MIDQKLCRADLNPSSNVSSASLREESITGTSARRDLSMGSWDRAGKPSLSLSVKHMMISIAGWNVRARILDKNWKKVESK